MPPDTSDPARPLCDLSGKSDSDLVADVVHLAPHAARPRLETFVQAVGGDLLDAAAARRPLWGMCLDGRQYAKLRALQGQLGKQLGLVKCWPRWNGGQEVGTVHALEEAITEFPGIVIDGATFLAGRPESQTRLPGLIQDVLDQADRPECGGLKFTTDREFELKDRPYKLDEFVRRARPLFEGLAHHPKIDLYANVGGYQWPYGSTAVDQLVDVLDELGFDPYYPAGGKQATPDKVRAAADFAGERGLRTCFPEFGASRAATGGNVLALQAADLAGLMDLGESVGIAWGAQYEYGDCRIADNRAALDAFVARMA